jgi:glucose-6-phosphate isomerase
MDLINKTTAWMQLEKHHEEISTLKMQDLFAKDPLRFKNFSLSAADIFLDYSKNKITAATLELLLKLTEEADLSTKIHDMFTGKIINTTEQRAVLHTALRNPENDPITVDGINIMPEIHATLNLILQCAEQINEGIWLGYDGERITDIVNIGIGGSDLGPAMVVNALLPYKTKNINCHFVSNVDATHISETLKHLNPKTTLFIIASKTFTTQETLCNASTAKAWLEQTTSSKNAVAQHFIAVTAKPQKALEFGIVKNNIYPFWDWVGGRYSLWSAIGLSIAIAIGADNFKDLLAGAHTMDKHFHDTPFAKNIPVIMALIGIWNINFLKAKSYAILPYDQYLALLPAYMQQLEMESNGKSVTIAGQPLTYATSPVIWGAVETNGQHAFHQLLLQGTQQIPMDFIVSANSHNPIGEHHLYLFANCLAQSQALMQGKTQAEAEQELLQSGMNKVDAKKLSAHKVIAGNIPSNTIVTNKITPKTLGALIALYEHKVFVQSVIWNINAFDQWGVELGKQLAKNVIHKIQNANNMEIKFDNSTEGLIQFYLKHHEL